jgi:hypothetical protein
VVVLIHGFRYAPGDPPNDPHRLIFAAFPQVPSWKVISWPTALGFSADDPQDGVCIGFGWCGMGRSRTTARAFAEAYDAAGAAGVRLADLVTRIRAIAPDRRVDVVTHSVGARVLIAALPHLSAGAFGRVVLLAAAEYDDVARAGLDTPAGRDALFYNVQSLENRLYETLFERFGPRRIGRRRALGRGGPAGYANWIDLRLDCAETIGALAGRGVEVLGRQRLVCHWSLYLRPGIFDLYRMILRQRDGWCPSSLRALAPIEGPRQPRRGPGAIGGTART